MTRPATAELWLRLPTLGDYSWEDSNIKKKVMVAGLACPGGNRELHRDGLSGLEHARSLYTQGQSSGIQYRRIINRDANARCAG